VGSSSNAVDLGVAATIDTGNISADGDVTIYADLDVDAGLITGSIDSAAGGLTLVANSGAVGSYFDIGQVTVDQEATITFVGAADSTIDIDGVESVSDSVVLALTVGANGYIDVGVVSADEVGAAVSVTSTAGKGSNTDIGQVSADAGVSLLLTTGLDTTNSLGAVTTANAGDIDLQVNLHSSAAFSSTLTATSFTGTRGNIVVSNTTVGDSGTLDLGSLTADGTGATVSLGADGEPLYPIEGTNERAVIKSIPVSVVAVGKEKMLGI
jgi:hypothetical protein